MITNFIESLKKSWMRSFHPGDYGARYYPCATCDSYTPDDMRGHHKNKDCHIHIKRLSIIKGTHVYETHCFRCGDQRSTRVTFTRDCGITNCTVYGKLWRPRAVKLEGEHNE